MNFIKVLLFILLFGFHIGLSQRDDPLTRVDSFVSRLPQDIEFFDLPNSLFHESWSEREKARAIFFWMATNISYDYERMYTGYWRKYQSLDGAAWTVFHERKGVCGSISRMFSYLAEEAGLDSWVISGYLRATPEEGGEKIEDPVHAWNAVKINGHWHLLDVTSAITHVDFLNANKFDNYYFLPPPQELIFSTFPKDPKWQLLDPVVEKKVFDRLPYISSSIVSHFSLAQACRGVEILEGSRIRIILPKIDQYSYSFYLTDDPSTLAQPVFDYVKVEYSACEEAYIIKIDKKGHLFLRVDGHSHSDGPINWGEVGVYAIWFNIE